MREAFRHPEHAFVIGGQFQRNVLSEGRRVFAYVHSHIQHRTLHHAHKLGLRVLNLVVQAAQHVFDRTRVIVLHEIHIAPGDLSKLAAIEAFEKKSALIAEHARFDNQQVGNTGLNRFHAAPLSFSTCIRYAP